MSNINCGNCLYLDTSVSLCSNPPRYRCTNSNSQMYTVVCSTIVTNKCSYHKLKDNR